MIALYGEVGMYSYYTEWSPGYDGTGRTIITRNNYLSKSGKKQENRVFTQYIVVVTQIYWVESNHHVAREIHCLNAQSLKKEKTKIIV